VGPAARFELAQLFDLGVEMLRAPLRRERPGISEDETDARVIAWLHDRPRIERIAGDDPP
jgi:hypothetical protein